MISRIIAIVTLLAFVCVASLHAQVPTTAKVSAIEGNKVQIAFTGDTPAWIKKGTVLKLATKAGKAVDNAAKVSEVAAKGATVTVKEKPTVAVGEELTVRKGKSMTGC
jgi:hypothetical protein